LKPLAIVTGARVGIGLATALACAEAGMRVAITSRSGPEDPTDHGTETLRSAVAAIEAAGGEAMGVKLNLADRASIDAALAAIDTEWGAADILVNNALCDQPAAQAPIREIDFGAFETMIVGEVVNTSYLTRLVLDQERAGHLSVINVGSAAADHIPPVPIGQGGWAFSYAATKAALHRLGGFLQLEYGDRVRAFTVNPGLVRTERLIERMGDLMPGGVAPSVPARVIVWLATDPAADAHLGAYLHAQEVAKDNGWL
jgi:NAD(P)-dependent dehydrogenase (short-subunit alcohol dehydrogenase family)